MLVWFWYTVFCIECRKVWIEADTEEGTKNREYYLNGKQEPTTRHQVKGLCYIGCRSA